MTGTRQHFQPAAIIGGFGVPAALDASRRDFTVFWRRREWTEPRQTTASNIGYRNGMYRLIHPPVGMDRDHVDQVWGPFENALPKAIEEAHARKEGDDSRAVLVDYVAMIGVRHPEFGDAVNRWRTELDMPLVAGDQVHLERLDILGRAHLQVRGFRWRFVHSPPDAHRFILNDRGWVYFGEQDRPGRALFVPLNSRLAMIGWLDRETPGIFDHRLLRPSWVRWLNAATWHDAAEYVVGHPDDAPMIRKLRPLHEASRRLHAAGPFRGHDHGLLAG